LYKKQQLAEAKVEQERIKEVKKKERKEKTERLAASRAEKQCQKEAENTQKALQLSQRGKRPASEEIASKSKRARGAVGLQVKVVAAEEAPPEPPKQSRTQTIRRPNRYSK
jgi:23S rRNA pseudoU1915 N3-methylase RlmH